MERVPQVLRQFIGNIKPDIYFTGQSSFMAQSHEPNKMWEKFNLFHCRAIRVIPKQCSTFQEHGDDWKQETQVLWHEFTSY